jgi:hypothetical protein
VNVSLYQLHRCIWDKVRTSGTSSGTAVAFDASRYELTRAEREAFEGKDVAALYQLGLHPVLLNGFCRASGFARDEYRAILAPFAEPETRKARWQT